MVQQNPLSQPPATAGWMDEELVPAAAMIDDPNEFAPPPQLQSLAFADKAVEENFENYTFVAKSAWAVVAVNLMVATSMLLTVSTNLTADTLNDTPTSFFKNATWHGSEFIVPQVIYGSVGASLFVSAVALLVARGLGFVLSGKKLEWARTFTMVMMQATHLSLDYRWDIICTDGVQSLLLHDPAAVPSCMDRIDPYAITGLLGAFILPVRWTRSVPLLYMWLPTPLIVRLATGRALARLSDLLWFANALVFAVSMVTTDFRLRKQFVSDERVAFQTETLARAREASAQLLGSMLPRGVLRRVVRGERIADSAVATALYSDVVGFTAWCSVRRARDVVTMLNSMYRLFDAGLERYGILKIKTVGDAYWCICGLPETLPDHAARACAFGMFIQRCIPEMALRDPRHRIEVRVGVHSGYVCAGLVGVERSTYDAFGVVNSVAERVEQAAPPGAVAISAATLGQLNNLRGLVYCRTSPHSVIETAPGVTETFLLQQFEWSSALAAGDSPVSAVEPQKRGSLLRTSVTTPVDASRAAVFRHSKLFQLGMEFIGGADRLTLEDVQELDVTARANHSPVSQRGHRTPSSTPGSRRSLDATAVPRLEEDHDVEPAGAATTTRSNLSLSFGASGGDLELPHQKTQQDGATELVAVIDSDLPNKSTADDVPEDDDDVESGELAEEKSLNSLRARWAACSRCAHLTFDDPVVEREFTAWAFSMFPEKYRPAAVMLGAIAAIIYVVILIENNRHEWYVHALLGAVVVSCLASPALISKLHPYVGLAVFYGHAIVLLGALTADKGRSLATSELLYVPYNFMIVGAHLGFVGGFSYIYLTLLHFVFLFLPFVGAQVAFKTLYMHHSVAPQMMILVWVIGLRRSEIDARQQFINKKAVDHALFVVLDEHVRITKLIGKMVPSFIVDDLAQWYRGPRTTPLAAHFATLGILFMRVPSLEASLAAADAREVMAVIDQYVTLCDHVTAKFFPTCTKLKIVGDIVMVASGLHHRSYARARRRQSEVWGGDSDGSHSLRHGHNSSSNAEGSDASDDRPPTGGEAAVTFRHAGSDAPPPRRRTRLRRTTASWENASRGSAGSHSRSSARSTGVITIPQIEQAIHLLDLALLAVETAETVKCVLGRRVIAGMHCGPATAGIIGDTRLILDVFGDCCNCASRIMTSASEGLWASAMFAESARPSERLSFGESLEREAKGCGKLLVRQLVATLSPTGVREYDLDEDPGPGPE